MEADLSGFAEGCGEGGQVAHHPIGDAEWRAVHLHSMLESSARRRGHVALRTAKGPGVRLKSQPRNLEAALSAPLLTGQGVAGCAAPRRPGPAAGRPRS